MENFFNYVTKPLSPEDIDVWFRSNNIIPEKLVLYYDFVHSLTSLIIKTYLGDSDIPNETKITMSSDENENHFKWCWDKTIDNFIKESITYSKDGEHYEYFKTFYIETFYNQKDEFIRNSLTQFFNELFDCKTYFTKSDLDLILGIYKVMEKNLIK
jgi:hypothetical protein